MITAGKGPFPAGTVIVPASFILNLLFVNVTSSDAYGNGGFGSCGLFKVKTVLSFVRLRGTVTLPCFHVPSIIESFLRIPLYSAARAPAEILTFSPLRVTGPALSLLLPGQDCQELQQDCLFQ